MTFTISTKSQSLIKNDKINQINRKITQRKMGYPKELQESIDLWLKYDGNDETRREILDLCKNGENEQELHGRMDERIQFGTAGLRATMQAGWSKMNTLTVLQASQGLCSYIKSTEPSSNHSIVIGHDHRYHSREFAEITAKCFLLQGFQVYYLNCPTGDEKNPDQDIVCHTPLVPFAINELNAGCGVMVTASHNPAQDNGFKVYYKNGCQIIPPHDNLISKEIMKNLKPQEGVWNDFKDIVEENKDLFFDMKKEMTGKYLDKVCDKLIEDVEVLGNKASNGSKPWFVYTPMHGVGYEIFSQLMSQNGLFENKDYLVVAEQKYPDPSFPTVSFPNPEEKGALKLSIELAQKNGIKLVVANDPDADRFSVAIAKSNSETHPEFLQLNGNEIGYLFAYYEFLKNGKEKEGEENKKQIGMLNSTVSSSLLKYMAQREGFEYRETLTGFKWIGNIAQDLEKEIAGLSVPFAYEEAIGYMFPVISYDKDGISALLVFLQLYLKFDKDMLKTLDEIYEKYGYFKQHNDYYVLPNPKINNEIFSFIRNHLNSVESEKNEHITLDIFSNGDNKQIIKDRFIIENYRDLTVGFQTNRGVPDLPIDPSSEMITFWLKTVETSNELKVTMRGSGTEPKLKIYIECMNKTDEHEAQLYADHMWKAIEVAWIRPEVTGLHTR